MTTETMFDGFEEFDHAKYEDEARERWGDTDAFQESARRTRQYGKPEWDAIKTEGGEILAAFAAAMAAGKRPRDPEVQAIAERHRLHIDRWFYPCSKQMHATVAAMYTQDPRFEAFYEKVAKGLAAFVSEAIVAAAE